MTNKKYTDDSIDGYSDRYMECREVGNHSWRKTQWEEDPRPGTFGVAKIRQCMHCPVKRYDVYNDRGLLLTRRYIYPPGYQIEGGGFTPQDFRAESIARSGVLGGKRHLHIVKEGAA